MVPSLGSNLVLLDARFPMMCVGVLWAARRAMRSSPHARYGGAATPHIGVAPRRIVARRPVAVEEVVLAEEA